MQYKLYNLRKAKGLTQKELAKELDISEVSYRNKELSRNAFNADEMFIISKIFDEDIDDIFLPRKSPVR